MSFPERNILLSEAEVADLAVAEKPAVVKKKAGRKPKWLGVEEDGTPVAPPADMLPAPPAELKAKRAYKKKVKVAEPAPAPIAEPAPAPAPVPATFPEGFTLLPNALLIQWKNNMGVQNALMDLLQKQVTELRAIEVEYWAMKADVARLRDIEAQHKALLDKEAGRLAKGRESTARYMANLVKKATK